MGTEVVVSEVNGALEVIQVGLGAQQKGVQVGWLLKSIDGLCHRDWHLGTPIVDKDIADIVPLLSLHRVCDESKDSLEIRFRSKDGEAITFDELAYGVNKLRGQAKTRDCQLLKRMLHEVKEDVKFIKKQAAHGDIISTPGSSVYDAEGAILLERSPKAI